jgi:hypothetical protein
MHGTGRMTGIEHRPVASIKILHWTKRGQEGDIDEGIIRHRGSPYQWLRTEAARPTNGESPLGP